MNKAKRALAIAGVLATFGLVACGAPSTEDTSSGAEAQPLRGGTVVTGATGVVDFSYNTPDGWSHNCTGSMIGPNVVLAAAHCFDAAGSTTAHDGSIGVTVNYYDPVAGRRQVYSGTADWHVYPTYDGAGPTGPGGSNDDMSIIVTPSAFTNTDYHDYLRIYADVDGPLDANLTAYGAGVYTYSGHSDDKLRTSWFEVESVDINHLVVDTRDLVGVCHGDSGGPLIKMANHEGISFPLVVGVLSKSETDPGGEGEECTNNDPPHDDAFYCRANSTRLGWIEGKLGRGCGRPANTADLVYRRCFDPPFIEDVPGEGLTQDVETAIAMAVL